MGKLERAKGFKPLDPDLGKVVLYPASYARAPYSGRVGCRKAVVIGGFQNLCKRA